MTEVPEPASRPGGRDRSRTSDSATSSMGPAQGRRILTAAVLGVALAALVVAAAASLRWRYTRDSPLMAYTGFLVDNGAVPYRDFWDMNLPGTYAVMALMGKVFGWSDLGFRAFDLILLAALSVITFWWVRPSGRLAAACAALAFPLYYLSAGPYVSMQREYIALVPFAVAPVLAVGFPGRRLVLRGLLVGLLTAATVLVKPNFVILGLPAMAVLFREAARSGCRSRLVTAAAAGLLAPVAVTSAWLSAVGALRPFLDIATNFWPMYAYMAGAIEPIHGLARVYYIGRSVSNGLVSSLLPWALLGILSIRRVPGLKPQMPVLCGLVILSAIYPALSGQLLSYHWLPFHYIVLCAALLAIRLPRPERPSPVALAPWLAALTLLLVLSTMSLLRAVGESGPREHSMPDEVAGFLTKRLRPGETVQPLDNVDGAVHGLLIARARLATRFLYDFNFYHHTDRPCVQRLRREFMAELSDASPALIIDVLGSSLHRWPKGANTTREFPELEKYITDNYEVVLQQKAFRILEAKHRRVEPSVVQVTAALRYCAKVADREWSGPMVCTCYLV